MIEHWKNSEVVKDLYFATATFAFESKPYFPNSSNHYILVKYAGLDNLAEGISKYQRPNSSLFLFNNETELFEKYHEKVSYVSMYYTRYDQDNHELRDIAGILARRDMVVSANLGNLKFMNNKNCHLFFHMPTISLSWKLREKRVIKVIRIIAKKRGRMLQEKGFLSLIS